MRVAVRTDRYRMDVTAYAGGKRVTPEHADGHLFDLWDDPFETRNLWAQPSVAPVVRDLWQAINTGLRGLDHPPELFSSQKGSI